MSDRSVDMTGALFRNEKRTSENAPLYTGSITIGGKKWRLAAWLNESKSGEKYMSLKASEPQESTPRLVQRQPGADEQEDIPF